MTDLYARRVGRNLNGKWSLTALLGVGGTSAVYSAVHRNGRRAAVKILHPELALNGEFVSRFLREGYIANHVDHPGVVSVLDDDRTDDGLVYLVMDLLVGASLHDVLERRGSILPLQEALTITDAILVVVAAAHDKGVIHRDIKPENVFLVEGGIRILDFGIAKAPQSAGAAATQTGTVFGTMGFMPPEQARGRAELMDARTDVFAVGATLYTMLSGKRLHEAGTAAESLLLAMTEPVAPMRLLLPSAPPSVAQIMDCAMAFDQQQRWPNARAMLTAVREAMHAIDTQCDSPKNESSQHIHPTQQESSPPQASQLDSVHVDGGTLPVLWAGASGTDWERSAVSHTSPGPCVRAPALAGPGVPSIPCEALPLPSEQLLPQPSESVVGDTTSETPAETISVDDSTFWRPPNARSSPSFGPCAVPAFPPNAREAIPTAIRPARSRRKVALFVSSAIAAYAGVAVGAVGLVAGLSAPHPVVRSHALQIACGEFTRLSEADQDGGSAGSLANERSPSTDQALAAADTGSAEHSAGSSKTPVAMAHDKPPRVDGVATRQRTGPAVSKSAGPYDPLSIRK